MGGGSSISAKGLDISIKKLPYLGGGVGKKSKFWGQLDQNDMRTF